MLYLYHYYFTSNLYYNSIVNFSKNIDIVNSKCYNQGGDNLPIVSQLKLVQAWIEIRKEDLITLWNMLQSGNGCFTIEPLK